MHFIVLFRLRPHLLQPSVPSRKHMEDVHYSQGLKPHSFCGLYVRAEALTHKEGM